MRTHRLLNTFLCVTRVLTKPVSGARKKKKYRQFNPLYVRDRFLNTFSESIATGVRRAKGAAGQVAACALNLLVHAALNS